jgi:hypothetical protein
LNVVKAKFPIPKDGILGHTFLSENKAIIDICNKTMIINYESENANVNNDVEYFSLNPRTKTIVELPISDTSVQIKNIILHKQEVIKNVYCSNVIGTVKNGKIIVNILNISEDKEIIKLNDLNMSHKKTDKI